MALCVCTHWNGTRIVGGNTFTNQAKSSAALAAPGQSSAGGGTLRKRERQYKRHHARVVSSSTVWHNCFARLPGVLESQPCVSWAPGSFFFPAAWVGLSRSNTLMRVGENCTNSSCVSSHGWPFWCVQHRKQTSAVTGNKLVLCNESERPLQKQRDQFRFCENVQLRVAKWSHYWNIWEVNDVWSW